MGGWLSLSAALLISCSSIPTPHQRQHVFPKTSVYLEKVDRPYTVLGWVRTKVDYPSLDPNFEEDDLCRNYFNKAAHDLLERAKKSGGDAVIDMKSVVFLEDGRKETYSTPECADDGMEGQILAQGIAIKWKNEEDRQSPPPFVRLPASSPASTPVQHRPKPVEPASISSPVPVAPRD